MKIWLDDVRPMPKAYNLHCTNDKEFINAVYSGLVTEISFDNDLGLHSQEGCDLAIWLMDRVYYGDVPCPEIMMVHSMNPVASRSIRATIMDIQGIAGVHNGDV